MALVIIPVVNTLRAMGNRAIGCPRWAALQLRLVQIDSVTSGEKVNSSSMKKLRYPRFSRLVKVIG
ncbi:hypothetical protein VS_1360 [Vibrio atlanticus]|uniref:Uncharacterized protein n=1 Tax=Vibrio atlanticus (strain LGP32) TaxID=575788 RepID=B7VNE7_VIBA3|nr:hypothetical protein VS_1360 [Vibrio atlanticus]